MQGSLQLRPERGALHDHQLFGQQHPAQHRHGERRRCKHVDCHRGRWRAHSDLNAVHCSNVACVPFTRSRWRTATRLRTGRGRMTYSSVVPVSHNRRS